MRVVARDGVRWPNVFGIRTETIFAMCVADSVLARHGLELEITCAVDGRHSRASLHYTGNAFDCRIHSWPQDKRREIATEIGGALGPDFDAVLEPSHFHVEYQPKKGINQ